MSTDLPVADAYDHWSATYDAQPSPLVALVDEVLAGETAPLRVVELGCGTGRNLAAILSRGTLRAIGVDLSSGMLDVARKRRVEARWIQADLAAGERLDLLDGCADVVLISLVLEHVEDLRPVFAEAARLLADGGCLRVLELHPDAAARGSRARIALDGEEHTTACFVHDAEALDAAARASGLEPGVFAAVHPSDELALRFPSSKRTPGVPWLLSGRWTRPERTVPSRYRRDAIPRHAALAFYGAFGSPTFELTVDVALGDLRARCKAAGRPFHLVALHAATRALRAVPELMLRLDGDEVVQHHTLQVGSTCLDHAERVGFVYFPAHRELDRFIADARQATEQGRQQAVLRSASDTDSVFFSNVPWLSFRSITHADTLDPNASEPRLTFGGVHRTVAGEALPVSLSVHHGLADGLQVSWFFRYLRHFLSTALR